MLCVLHLQGMGPALTAGIVQQLGVTATAALVTRFEGSLTGDLVQHFGPGKHRCVNSQLGGSSMYMLVGKFLAVL